MASPIERTFYILKNSANQSAISLLVSLLDSTNTEILEMAIESLATAKKSSAHLELINQYDRLADPSKQKVWSHASTMNRALEDALQHGDDDLKRTSLEIVLEGKDYKMIKGLLKVLSSSENEQHERNILECVRQLTDSLYQEVLDEELEFGQCSSEMTTRVHDYINEIEHAAHDMGLQEYMSSLVEFVLILGVPGDLAVDRVMKSNVKIIRQKSEEVLLASQHAGVMALAARYLLWKMPHKSALKAYEKRTDPEFVFTVLRKFPDELTDLDRRNFAQIQNVSWLSKKESLLEMMSPSLQVTMVRFVSAVGIPDNFKTIQFQWVISNCSAEACQEAGSVLDMLKTEEVSEMINDGLDSENEGVQAWAVTQLREQHVPDAMKKIMERLDSNVEVVREAARKELESFNVDYIMQAYDKLNPQICSNIGVLIKKVDPQYKQKISSYLAGSIVSQKLRAIQVVKLLGLYNELIPELIALADDKDQQVKRTLIEVLRMVDDPQVIVTLKKMSEDGNNKVKQSSLEAIKKLSEKDWLKDRLGT